MGVNGPTRHFPLQCGATAASARRLWRGYRHDAFRATDVSDAARIPAVAAIGKSFEGATKRQHNPHRKGTLAWVPWIVDRGRPSRRLNIYRPPGPKTMAAGSQRLLERLQGFAFARQLRDARIRQTRRGGVPIEVLGDGEPRTTARCAHMPAPRGEGNR